MKITGGSFKRVSKEVVDENLMKYGYEDCEDCNDGGVGGRWRRKCDGA